MKKLYVLISGLFLAAGVVNAQVTSFPGQLNTVNWGTTTVQMPASPLRTQILFVGGIDSVAHKAITNGSVGTFPAGFSPAKQWHDYIGFTQDTALGTQDIGWVSINHETVFKDDKLGDGGGMTVFKVRRVTVPGGVDSIVVVPQNLSSNGFPNVSTKFFSVDFKGTVGETGMNCGGITNYADGRIWTAEEWFRTSNASVNTAQNAAFSAGGSFPMLNSGQSSANQGVRDTTNFVINVPGNPFGFNGQSIPRWQNFNWMVEIDPRTGAAIRKQYNWGRSGWEGGIVAADNRTVYLGDDATPGLFVK